MADDCNKTCSDQDLQLACWKVLQHVDSKDTRLKEHVEVAKTKKLTAKNPSAMREPSDVDYEESIDRRNRKMRPQ